jgi:hypothetical protein
MVWYSDWNFWVSAGTLAVAVTTAYYAWETRKLRQGNDRALETSRAAMEQQAEDTQRSLKVAETTAKAAEDSAEATKLLAAGQRAWITVSDSTVTHGSPHAPSPLDIHLRVKFVNGGLTPAINVSVRRSIEIMREFPGEMPIKAKPDLLSMTVIGPGDIRVVELSRRLSQSELSLLTSRANFLFAFGYVTYLDILKREPHKTEWCFIYFPDRGEFGFHSSHNTVD